MIDSNIPLKHREDVIDTLQLRIKERRVLFSLIIVLLLTLAYENSSILTSALWGDDFSAPELGSRPKTIFKADMLDRFERPLAAALQAFPQYRSHFQTIIDNMNSLKTSPISKSDANEKIHKFAAALNELITHPSLVGNKDLKTLEKELKQFIRILKISLPPGKVLKDISFNRNTPEKNSEKTTAPERNLFEYSQDN